MPKTPVYKYDGLRRRYNKIRLTRQGLDVTAVANAKCTEQIGDFFFWLSTPILYMGHYLAAFAFAVYVSH